MTKRTRVRIQVRDGLHGYGVYGIGRDGRETFLEWLSRFELVHQRYPDATFSAPAPYDASSVTAAAATKR